MRSFPLLLRISRSALRLRDLLVILPPSSSTEWLLVVVLPVRAESPDRFFHYGFIPCDASHVSNR